jgi:hypothetical protein
MNERAENGNTDDGVFKRAGIFIKNLPLSLANC